MIYNKGETPFQQVGKLNVFELFLRVGDVTIILCCVPACNSLLTWNNVFKCTLNPIKALILPGPSAGPAFLQGDTRLCF